MGQTIHLTAADGFRFPAYEACPAGAAKGAVVVLQEIFGVNSHIRAVADVYAAQGYLALAPATFHRVKPDAELGYTPGDIAMGRDLKAAVEALPAPGVMPDIAAAIAYATQASTSMKRPAEKIKQINQLYAAAVKRDAQVTFIQTWLLFADGMGDARQAEFPDLLHPNKAGYAKWAAALTPILSTLGFVENEPETFVPEPGFTSLFNGRDLTGWGFKTNTFDGSTRSSDGRYVAHNGKIVVTTPPEGSRIEQMWTTQQFPKDFILKLEFRAGVNADSGIFLRQPQLQCRDYLIAGPYKQLQKYRPQEWNEIVAVVTNGVAYCTCNGEVLEAAYKVPPTGPIGLEGDHGQMEYRRLQLRELP